MVEIVIRDRFGRPIRVERVDVAGWLAGRGHSPHAAASGRTDRIRMDGLRRVRTVRALSLRIFVPKGAIEPLPSDWRIALP